jgi:hypothetical protein
MGKESAPVPFEHLNEPGQLLRNLGPFLRTQGFEISPVLSGRI